MLWMGLAVWLLMLGWWSRAGVIDVLRRRGGGIVVGGLFGAGIVGTVVAGVVFLLVICVVGLMMMPARWLAVILLRLIPFLSVSIFLLLCCIHG